jgi:2,4-dienoyl-CoA reductase-like NADH-dependent reductase (Old Yellow Enzyme family)
MPDQPFPHIFQPLKLRHKTLKHRLVFGAHTANMGVEGLPAIVISLTTVSAPVAALR